MKRNQSCCNRMCGVCCPRSGEQPCVVHNSVGQSVLRRRRRAEEQQRMAEAEALRRAAALEEQKRAEEARQAQLRAMEARRKAEAEARRKVEAEAARRELKKREVSNEKTARRVRELEMLLAKWDSEDGSRCKQKHWPECMMCMDEPVDTTFFPCGHMIACNSCAKRAMEVKPACPKCRAGVRSYQKLFVDV